MYLFSVTLSLCLAYFILYFFLPKFFNIKLQKIEIHSLFSVAIIFIVSLVGYFIYFLIPDAELSNRFLHGFGGGFMAFLVCFLVVRDLKMPINKFQFAVISILIVTALGVANELLEFFLQVFAGFTFAPDVNDTWLDLLSNTVGIIIAAFAFTPLVNKKTFVDKIIKLIHK